MEKQQIEERKKLARELQDNPLLREVIAECKGIGFSRWLGGTDTQQREMAWVYYQTVQMFETQIIAMLSNIERQEVKPE